MLLGNSQNLQDGGKININDYRELCARALGVGTKISYSPGASFQVITRIAPTDSVGATQNDRTQRNGCRGESCIRPSGGANVAGDHKDRPYGTHANSLGRIIQAFKSITTHQYVVGVKNNGWLSFPGRFW